MRNGGERRGASQTQLSAYALDQLFPSHTTHSDRSEALIYGLFVIQNACRTAQSNKKIGVRGASGYRYVLVMPVSAESSKCLTLVANGTEFVHRTVKLDETN